MHEEQPLLGETHFLRNVGLLVTYRCQVACPHCIIDAGPQRTEAVDPDRAKRWIREIVAWRSGHVRMLSLTGGEPFYDVRLLQTLSEEGARGGLRVSAVTNAFWATSASEAVRVLRSLPSLRGIAVSADVHHQTRIPLERVRAAVLAATELGIPYNIAMCVEDESAADHRELLARVLEFADPERVVFSEVFPVGRASRPPLTVNLGVHEPAPGACSNGATPIIFPDGRVVACIGPIIGCKRHPLELGCLTHDRLADVFDRAESNAVLHFIRVWGPAELHNRLCHAGVALQSRFAANSPCSVCSRLMSQPDAVDALRRLAQDSAFVERVAYGRAWYLNEPEMVRQIERQGTADRGEHGLDSKRPRSPSDSGHAPRRAPG